MMADGVCRGWRRMHTWFWNHSFNTIEWVIEQIESLRQFIEYH